MDSMTEETRRVLLIDDDVKLRTSLKRLLEQRGVDVIAAEDGREGIRLIRELCVDAVLVDIFMPDVDGFEVIRALRQLAPRVPIIAMSGGSARMVDFDPLKIARLMGAREAFAKPVTAHQLIDSVDRLTAIDASI
jgi:CheY-like chemotaxis protein